MVFFLCKNRKIKCRKCDAPHLTGRQFLKSLIENRQISDKEIISLIELVVSRSAVVIHQRNNRNHKNCNQNADHQSWILIKQRIYLYTNRYCKRLSFHLVKSRLALGSPSWWFVCLFVHHNGENGPVHRKLVVISHLVITSKVKLFFRPYKARNEWACQSFA